MTRAGGTAAQGEGSADHYTETVTHPETATTADSSTNKVPAIVGALVIVHSPADKPSWWTRHPLTWLTSSRCWGQPAPAPTGGTRRIPPQLQGHGPGKANSWSPSLLISQDDFLNGWERRGEGQQDGPKLLKHLPMAPMRNTQWSVKSVWIRHVEEKHLTGTKQSNSKVSLCGSSAAPATHRHAVSQVSVVHPPCPFCTGLGEAPQQLQQHWAVLTARGGQCPAEEHHSTWMAPLMNRGMCERFVSQLCVSLVVLNSQVHQLCTVPVCFSQQPELLFYFWIGYH